MKKVISAKIGTHPAIRMVLWKEYKPGEHGPQQSHNTTAAKAG